MAAPSFVAASTGSTDAGGAWSATCHAPGAAGRIIICQILQDGTTTNAVTFTSATNIEALDGTDNTWTQISGPLVNGTWAVGGSEEALQFIFIGRSLSTSAPTMGGGNSTSEDLYWRFYEFSNVSTGTTLATVIENSTAGNATNGVGTSGTIADTGVTTLGPDRLALNFVGINDDNAINVFTGQTGGDWTLATAGYAESSGTDASIGLQICTNPAAVWNMQQGTPVAYTTGSTTHEQNAQSFVAAGNVASASLWLKKNLAPSDDLIIEIQTDSAGVPSGTALGSVTIPAASLSTTTTLYKIPISASLTASSTYWLVARRSGALDNTNNYGIGYNNPGGYSGGEMYTLDDGSWTAGTGSDFYFALYDNSSGTGTIDGGTATNADAADGWGVVGFALIGTGASEVGSPTARAPHYPAIVFQDPAIV